MQPWPEMTHPAHPPPQTHSGLKCIAEATPGREERQLSTSSFMTAQLKPLKSIPF